MRTGCQPIPYFAIEKSRTEIRFWLEGAQALFSSSTPLYVYPNPRWLTVSKMSRLLNQATNRTRIVHYALFSAVRFGTFDKPYGSMQEVRKPCALIVR